MSDYLKLKSGIRIADLAGLSNRIVDFLEAEDLTAYPEYENILPNLKAQTDGLTEAMDRDKIESELADLDAVRDDAVRQLSTALEGYAVIPSDEIRVPAQALLDIFNKYGIKIVNYRYDAESGKIESLLQDFAEPTAVSHILNLPHFDVLVAALHQAQDNFEAKKVEYDRAVEYRKETTQSASEFRPALFDAINNQLVNYHAGMVQFRDETFRNIADTINNWIVDANNNI